MREQELSRAQHSVLACYDVEETVLAEPPRVIDGGGAEVHLRPMRTICLQECAIPE